MDKQYQEKIFKNAHEDLLEIGRRVEKMINMKAFPNTARNPISNPENAAANEILRHDPYVAEREKTEMRRDENGELAVQPIK